MKNNEHILDEFLSEVIHTLNSEEIYDAIINSMISLINPDGLLLALNGETSVSFTLHAYGAASHVKKIIRFPVKSPARC